MIRILLLSTLLVVSLWSKSIYITYEKNSQREFIGQICEFELNIIIAQREINTIHHSFSDEKNITLLNSGTWTMIDKNRYTLKFLGQINNLNYKLPDVTITVNQGENQSQESLVGEEFIASKIAHKHDFSGVIAQKLTLVDYKVEGYNQQMNKLSFLIEAINSNIKDIKLNSPSEYEVVHERLLEGYELSNSKFDVILPSYIKKYEFEYFNYVSESFEKISIPIDSISRASISNQNLKPISKTKNLFILIGVALVVIFLAILYYTYRKRFLLYILVTAIIVFAILLIPSKYLYINQNTPLRLIPADDSSVFYITADIEEVEELDRYRDYVQVMLSDAQVGWVQKEMVIGERDE